MHRTRFYIGALWLILIGLPSLNFVFRGANSHRNGPSLSYFSTPSETKTWRLYDSNPNHVWNRLYRTLYIRVARDGQEYGYDELDPLFWYNTKYLFSGPAY